MKILAIETSSQACSVAINKDGDIHELYQVAPRQHNQIILPLIEELFKTHDLDFKTIDAIAFGCGPGSFTGVRIAASITQGLAVSHDLPVIPISSLLVLAQSTYREYQAENVLVCLDARMNEVYWAECKLDKKNSCMMLTKEEQCLAPEKIQLPEKPEDYIGVGDGWLNYEILKAKSVRLNQCVADIYPHAKDLALLAGLSKDLLPVEKALPRYLRDIQYKEV